MATLSSAFEEINATAQSLHAERRNHAQRASPSTCGNTVLTSDSTDRKVVMRHFNELNNSNYETDNFKDSIRNGSEEHLPSD